MPITKSRSDKVELTPESTQPPPPAQEAPEDESPAAIPPIIDPAAFEDFPTFRETFLVYLTDSDVNDAFRTVAAVLYHMVLEYWQYWPEHPEGFVRSLLRASVADLRHLQGFLADVERQEDSSESRHESHLCRMAGGVARDVEALANRIEEELGSWRG